nr:aspartic proteinase cdr1 [Quercus suber]
MKYSVGTPPVEILGIADTGSDLTWLQCKPCNDCYNQTAPIFDPKRSRTYKRVACDSSLCRSLAGSSCSGYAGSSCLYSVAYGDQSFSNGDLATDTLTLGSTKSRPVPLPKTILGCGHDNIGTFEAQGKTTSKLNFGSNAVVSGSGVVSTPLVSGEYTTFYYLTLEAISVGRKRIDLINPSESGNSEGNIIIDSGTTLTMKRIDLINPSESGNSEGNIIIDSGTTLTMLPSNLYPKFESAVKDKINLPTTDDPNGSLSLCYKSSSDEFSGPSITAHFTGADVNLSSRTTFVRVDKQVVCLAFVPVDSIGIFGNLAQSNLLVGYDVVKKSVSFKPTDCTKL